MKRRDGAELLLLGALWGASFLFMRIGVPEFGPLAFVWVRVAGAAAMLLPLVLLRGEVGALVEHWRPIALVGVLNSALPFLFFMIAALVLSTGLMAIFNATAALWGALVAWLWLREKPLPMRLAGLAIGMAGVVGLVWGKIDFKPNEHGVSPAIGIAACLLASLLYGIAANYTKKRLTGVPPMAVAAGSQLAAGAALLLPAIVAWPTAAPSGAAWSSAAALAIACTGLAYILYFRLIANTGPSGAISVTYLVPLFAMLWGAIFIGEKPTAAMLICGALILLGVALSTGLVSPSRLLERLSGNRTA